MFGNINEDVKVCYYIVSNFNLCKVFEAISIRDVSLIGSMIEILAACNLPRSGLVQILRYASLSRQQPGPLWVGIN